MGIISCDGVVAREVKVGEYDKILTVISPKYGKIKVSGKGVRSIKNKNSAGTGLLSYSSFELKEGREIHTIVQCELKENFYDLRKDLYRLSVGCYFGELASFVARENEPCEPLVKLLLNALYFLQKEECPADALKAIFELRLLVEEGLAPSADACVFCGSEKDLRWFDTQEGCAVCESCREAACLPAGDEVCRAMDKICRGTLKEALTTPIPQSAMHHLGILAEKMITTHIAPSLRSLEYLKSLEQ